MVPSPSEMATVPVKRYILPLRILTGQLKKFSEKALAIEISNFSIISRNHAPSAFHVSRIIIQYVVFYVFHCLVLSYVALMDLALFAQC